MSSLSIKNRILIAMALGPGLVLFVGGVVIHGHWHQNQIAAMHHALEEEVKETSIRLRHRGKVFDFDEGPPNLDKSEVIWVVSPPETAPRILLGLESQNLSLPTLPAPSLQAKPLYLRLESKSGAWSATAITAVPHYSNEPAWIILARSNAALDAETRDHALLLLRWGSIILGLTLLAAWLAVHLGLRPLDPLLDALKKVDPADSAIEFAAPPHLPKELTPIAQCVSTLLERVQAAVTRERELGLALAHDLRTPVTALRSALEVARDTPHLTPDMQAALAACLHETEALGMACKRLLKLERLTRDANEQPNLTRVDLSEATRQMFARLAMSAAARDIRLDQWGYAHALVDADLLDLALYNAFENAIRHAPHGGNLEAVISQTSDAALLKLANGGCKISPADADKVFIPNWRGDGARTESRLGLGGALIARAMAHTGGKASIHIEGDRFTLILALPLAPPAPAA